MSREKFPSTPPSTPSEETAPTEFLPPEQVLYEFDRLHGQTVGGELPPDEREKVVNRLHDLAERLGNTEMLAAYESGRVPTFASMEAAVSKVDAHLAQDSEDPESIKLRKLLSQRVREIRRWCSKYEQSVVVFHSRKRHLTQTQDEDAREAFARIDMQRRLAHESLMESIRLLDILIEDADEIEKLPESIARMHPRQLFQEGFAEQNPAVFSAEAATDAYRDDIKDWALIANLMQKIDAQNAHFAQANKE